MPDTAEPIASFSYFHGATVTYTADGLHVVEPTAIEPSVEKAEVSEDDTAGEHVRAFLEKRKPSPWQKPEAEQSKPHQHLFFAQPPSTEES